MKKESHRNVFPANIQAQASLGSPAKRFTGGPIVARILLLRERSGSVVVSACPEIEWLRVRASPALLCCVLEQDTFNPCSNILFLA